MSRLIHRSHTYEQHLLRLSNVLVEHKDYKNAIDVLKTIESFGNCNSECMKHIGTFYLSLGDSSKALEYCRELSEMGGHFEFNFEL
jgi:predicted negative regulator of RcsB-dependent stress response